MSFAAYRFEATKAAGIVYYCKAFATKEMLKQNQTTSIFEELKLLKNNDNHLIISKTE